MVWTSLVAGSSSRNNVLVRLMGHGRSSRASSSVEHTSPVAGFDLDDTLIETWSGLPPWRRKSANDWTWRYPSVMKKLRSELQSGRRVVIFSNQSHIRSAHDGKGATKLKKVIDNMIASLRLGSENQGIAFIASTQKDEFRKGYSEGGELWSIYEELAGIQIDTANSFYVGDAAGREGDIGSSDLAFAEARNIRFMTPEEYFEVDEGPGGNEIPIKDPLAFSLREKKRS